MTAIERLARATDRVFDRLRHRSAFGIDVGEALDGDLRSLRGRKYAVLVTFRRDGTPVPSPVWCAVDRSGRGYIKTASDVGKIKRIRHDDRVLIAPSNARGRPAAPPVRAKARVLSPQECAHAEQTLAARYGVGRRAAEWLLAATGPPEYLEITACRPH